MLSSHSLDRRRFLQASATAAGLSLAAVGQARAQTAAPAGAPMALPTGTTLFVETQGSGRPMLVIHGGLGLDHTYFQPWLDPLAAGFKLVYPDLRGNGHSPAVPDAELTMDKMAADLDALRVALGFKQWAVLGHSYGGFVAQAYALKYPQAVSYLMLADTSPAPRFLAKNEAPAMLRPAMTPAIEAAFHKLFAVASGAEPEGGDAEWRTIWHTIIPAYFHDFPTDLLVATDRTTYRERALVQGVTASAKFDTRPALAGVNLPTLVMVGRHDAILPVAQSEVLYKGIPEARLLVFERSGHFPFIEERDRFLGEVRSFLGSA